MALHLLAFATLGFVAISSYRQRSRKTDCDMSWSHPGWADWSGKLGPVRLGAHYRLWRYEHNGQRRGAQPESALPVLFVPGHQGSYHQARSLCSAVAADHPKSPVDCWATDFGEEPTALLGHAMWKQAEYINDAIAAIRDAYPSGVKPAVTVLGHSLGGTVSRGAFVLPNYRPSSIATLITLASPHTAPPVSLDAEAARFYAAINAALAEAAVLNRFGGSSPCAGVTGGTCPVSQVPPSPGVVDLMNVTQLSLSSGAGDVQVWEGLARITDVVDAAVVSAEVTASIDGAHRVAKQRWRAHSSSGGGEPDVLDGDGEGAAAAEAGITAGSARALRSSRLARYSSDAPRGLPVAWLSTTSLPTVGFGIDHAAIVWCRQLVAPLAAAIARLGAAHAMGESLDAHTRLEALLVALGGKLEVREKERSDEVGPLGGNHIVDTAGPLWRTLRGTLMWLVLAPTERAHWYKTHHSAEAAPVIDRNSAAATLHAFDAYLAGTVVRYGPALVVSACVACLLAISAKATTVAAASLSHGAVRDADAAQSKGDTVFSCGPLYRASMLPSVFVAGLLQRAFRSRVAQQIGLVALLALGACVALPQLGLTKPIYGAAEGLWNVFVESPVPFGIAVLCFFVAVGALDSLSLAARYALGLAAKRGALAAVPSDAALIASLHLVLAVLLTPTWIGTLDRVRGLVLRTSPPYAPRERATLGGDLAWLACAAFVAFQVGVRGLLRQGGKCWKRRQASRIRETDGILAAALFSAVRKAAALPDAPAASLGGNGAPHAHSPGAALVHVPTAGTGATHGSCASCCHEDGGREAVFAENSEELMCDGGSGKGHGGESPVGSADGASGSTRRRVVEVAPGVWLGPTFRVISCSDCWSRARADPRAIASDALHVVCEFCSCLCTGCGGHPEAQATHHRAQQDAGSHPRAGNVGAWSPLRVVMALLRLIATGTGDPTMDACVLAVAAAAGASTVSVFFVADAAHARDVVITVLTFVSGCCVAVMRRARYGPKPA